jgi:prepilin-type N-terminal cleavage/methylation domain-containing protein
MKSPIRAAFTLIEMMVVVILVSMILIPVFRTFHAGIKVATKGMLKVETTLEARRILKQIQTDLQDVCFPMDGREMTFSPESLVRETGTPPTTTYAFFSFPAHGPVESLITDEAGGIVWRNVSEITYSLSQGENSMYTLIRSERFHPSHPLASTYPGGIRVQNLSNQVNFFSIVANPFNTPTRSSLTFRVHLQLVDSVKKGELAQVVQGNSAAQRLKEGVIADFFSVVNPHFYNHLLNRGWFNPNWQTGIRSP